jgi:hypothetical protein
MAFLENITANILNGVGWLRLTAKPTRLGLFRSSEDPLHHAFLVRTS